jgi:hypothetical protein
MRPCLAGDDDKVMFKDKKKVIRQKIPGPDTRQAASICMGKTNGLPMKCLAGGNTVDRAFRVTGQPARE